MAIDETLLEGMTAPDVMPVLRLYGFSPPAVSLGRFQRAHEDLNLHAMQRDGVVLVRRPTGGQAVLHANELTYALILARSHLDPFTKRSAYQFVGSIVSAILQECGVDCRIGRSRQGPQKCADCFRTTGEYEVTSPVGRKLVGSAQMHTRHGCLQHGSIPLDNTHMRISDYLAFSKEYVDRSTSLAEESGSRVCFTDAREMFASAAGRVMDIADSDLSDQELQRAEHLVEKYTDESWNLMY